ncbi:MAG: ABC transporter ATP-binding protein [Candidatus Omnitrophica bacterium]|nr:ABC transporter ATP-binding protein [Candidatus Omnitrophota bacterium]
MSDELLAAEGLEKIYRDGIKEVRAVDGVSLRIKRGEASAIVGPSGAGKSTLLHMLGGLDSPTAGKVYLDGADIYGLSDGRRARIRNREIGFVFQFYHLLPEFTALENVMLPALMSGKRSGGKKDIKERALDLLRAVGLEQRLGHLPSELSGGESQRVAIARALINRPKLLLCDEPTGNLDSKTSESIYELLLGLQSGYSTTIIIVTHDENISSRVGNVVLLKDGKAL